MKVRYEKELKSMKELQKLLMQAETFVTKNSYELDPSEKNLLEK